MQDRPWKIYRNAQMKANPTVREYELSSESRIVLFDRYQSFAAQKIRKSAGSFLALICHSILILVRLVRVRIIFIFEFIVQLEEKLREERLYTSLFMYGEMFLKKERKGLTSALFRMDVQYGRNLLKNSRQHFVTCRIARGRIVTDKSVQESAQFVSASPMLQLYLWLMGRSRIPRQVRLTETNCVFAPSLPPGKYRPVLITASTLQLYLFLLVIQLRASLSYLTFLPTWLNRGCVPWKRNSISVR